MLPRGVKTDLPWSRRDTVGRWNLTRVLFQGLLPVGLGPLTSGCSFASATPRQSPAVGRSSGLLPALGGAHAASAQTSFWGVSAGGHHMPREAPAWHLLRIKHQ